MNVVDKIKNLLLKTVENGCSEQESNTAFILARKLMIKYKLSESDIKVSDENQIIQEELNFNFDDEWKYCLLNVFISNFGIYSYAINRNNGKHIVLFGFKINVECVKSLFECALNYLNINYNTYHDDYLELFGDVPDSLFKSYSFGFINGLSDKYEEDNFKLSNKEALVITPSKEVKSEFNNFTKGFEKQEFNYGIDTEHENYDLITISNAYNTGKSFGSLKLN